MTDRRDEDRRDAEGEKRRAETERRSEELRAATAPQEARGSAVKARAPEARERQEGEKMSENVPPPGQPGREAEVLEALREAVRHNPRLVELPPEEVARRLVIEDLLRDDPPVELVAEMMLELEVEEEEFDPDVQPDES